MTSLLQRAEAFAPDLVAVRRDLHRHPELSFAEHRTADVAARNVEALGFRVRRGIGRTGVVAEIGEGRPVVALRADMDALPIQEANDVDYRSTVDGVMHACGHDAHVAMLIGAARLLAQAHEAGRLAGTVRLLFQPSEETADEEDMSGAMRMIEDGAMAGVDAVFGLHIGAYLPAGSVHISPGPIMAGSDRFTATVYGHSAHAARPQEGIDAIVLAAHAVLACQSGVARNIAPDDDGVLTIGTVAGGSAENVVADRVTLRGTLRYYREEVRHALRRALERGCRIAEVMGGGYDIRMLDGYPPVVNDEGATRIAAEAAAATLGPDAVVAFEPLMYAEDFSILAREAPGCFLWLGAALEPAREHHQPTFDIDERMLPQGAAVLAACALHTLESRGTT
jgi:amidohydrolase